jgi:hypothetical protein
MSGIVKRLQTDFGIVISHCTIQTYCKAWGIVRQPYPSIKDAGIRNITITYHFQHNLNDTEIDWPDQIVGPWTGRTGLICK